MRYRPSGTVELDLPASQAIGMFTPEGEREYVPGWEPDYGPSGPSEEPGTVFRTAVGGTETIWVIMQLDRMTGTAEYARVTPGIHAGTVRVRCEPSAEGRTKVHIAYDISLLDGGDLAALDSFTDDRFERTLGDWESSIAARISTL